jgi:NAD(P)-dependent dehydrogenase (short-subunit alcohol dehydrogenase family)
LMQLKDKVIIVTGGGRGIGEALAVGYAQEGAKIVAASRSKGQLDQVVEKIQSQGGQAISVPTDVRSLPQAKNLAQQTVDQFGKIDVLVNNAGINPRGLFLDSKSEEWEQAWQINVVGVVNCCRAVLPVMQAQGHGNIINMGSGMGQVGREDGIIVNVLIPGPVKTELSRPMWEGSGEVLASSDPWKSPEQVVSSAVFLATQLPSSGMTGQILSIMRRNSP